MIIDLSELHGVWLGKEYNLMIVKKNNIYKAELINKSQRSVEFHGDIQLSEITDDSTRMLEFNDGKSIEIWQFNGLELTIKINNSRYELRRRQLK